MNKKIKIIIIDILIFIGFFVILTLSSILINKYISKDIITIETISYFIILLYFLLLYHQDFKSFFTDLKKNYKKYFPKYIIYGLISIFIMNILASIIASIIGNLPTNELKVRSTLVNKSFFILIINIGILIPFCEEILFRHVFKNIFNNKYLYAISMGLLFGSAHLLSSTSAIEYLYIIPYGFMGFVLSYIYYDSDNLLNSIIVHMLNNLLTLLLMVV